MIKVGCCGSFDYILHEGHLNFLRWAKAKGDYLIVFPVADITITQNKKREPFYNQIQRGQNLLDTNIVGEVIMCEGGTEEDIRAICVSDIAIYVFGPDQETKFDKQLSIQLLDANKTYFVCDVVKRHSTSKLLSAINLSSTPPEC